MRSNIPISRSCSRLVLPLLSFFALFTLLFSSLLPSAFAQSQSQSLNLGTFTATGAGAISQLRMVGHKHTLAFVVTGSPATCTIRFEGSIDGTTFFDLSGAQTCTSNLMFHVADKPVLYVRANLLTLSGGSSPSIRVSYLGLQ